MKAHRLTLAACVLVLGAVLVLLSLPSDVLAAGLSLLPSPHGHAFEASALLAATVATLRADYDALIKRGADKRAEIKEGMKPEEVRAIEADHAKLLADAEAKKRELDKAEADEREAQQRAQNQPKAWTAEEIGKLSTRALAFGMHAGAVTEVTGNPKIRTIEEATDALQELAVARKHQIPRQHPHIAVIADEGDKVRAAIGDGILLRANPQAITGTDTATRARIEAARQWRGMSILEMGRIFLEESLGLKVRGLSRMELASCLLGLQVAGRAAALSTSDFANILANVAAKRLRDAYGIAPQAWRQLGRQSNSPDFKTKSVAQLSSAPSFQRVREGQEYSYGALTDGAESYALATYGRIIPITRQALINDDLNAFDRLPMMMGRQAAELCASVFYAILTDNANLSDGVALFHATHANLASPGTAVDTTNLSAGRAAMRKQKSMAAKTADREPLNLVPKFILNSPDKETEVQQALTAVLAAQSSTVNVFANSLTQITEARITGNAWYLFADPAMIDTIEYAFLEGEEELFVEQRTGFEIDGLELKGRVDFAAKALDYRGMYKNPGN